MYDLAQIVARNREAVQQGHASPGTLVGTTKTTPIRYDVVAGQATLATNVTLAGCAQYRQLLNSGAAQLVPVDNQPTN